MSKIVITTKGEEETSTLLDVELFQEDHAEAVKRITSKLEELDSSEQEFLIFEYGNEIDRGTLLTILKSD